MFEDTTEVLDPNTDLISACVAKARDECATLLAETALLEVQEIDDDAADAILDAYLPRSSAVVAKLHADTALLDVHMIPLDANVLTLDEYMLERYVASTVSVKLDGIPIACENTKFDTLVDKLHANLAVLLAKTAALLPKVAALAFELPRLLAYAPTLLPKVALADCKTVLFTMLLASVAALTANKDKLQEYSLLDRAMCDTLEA